MAWRDFFNLNTYNTAIHLLIDRKGSYNIIYKRFALMSERLVSLIWDASFSSFGPWTMNVSGQSSIYDWLRSELLKSLELTVTVEAAKSHQNEFVLSSYHYFGLVETRHYLVFGE